MNDACCEIHNIDWSSSEIGMDCPACLADNQLAALREAAREYMAHSEYTCDSDGDCMICGGSGTPEKHDEWCDYRITAEKLAALLDQD